MRVTARRLVEAFRAGKSKTVGNSSVEITPAGFTVFRLHGHPILNIGPSGVVTCSLAGWPTPTTRSRVNDLFRGLDVDANLHQEDGAQFLRVGQKRTAIADGSWYFAGQIPLPARG